MKFFIRSFNELSLTELYDMLKLRCAVFVIEQDCNYQDMDDKDQASYHVIGFEDNKLVACTRILPKGISYPEVSIGRVIVDKAYRGTGAGKDIMKLAIDHAKKTLKADEIVISAQCYLEKFYGDLGFVSEGESYLDDDIPHIQMRLKA